MQEGLQRVFLYIFSLSDHNSELYFSKNVLVQALGNLLTFAVQHCRAKWDIEHEYCMSSGQVGRVVSLGPDLTRCQESVFTVCISLVP